MCLRSSMLNWHLNNVRVFALYKKEPNDSYNYTLWYWSLYTLNFRHNIANSHLQKFSNDTAIVELVTQGDKEKYKEVIIFFFDWCGQNRPYINTSMMKEMVIDFHRNVTVITPVNNQCLDIEIVEIVGGHWPWERVNDHHLIQGEQATREQGDLLQGPPYAHLAHVHYNVLNRPYKIVCVCKWTQGLNGVCIQTN